MKWFFMVFLLVGCSTFKQTRTPLDDLCFEACGMEYPELFEGVYVDESEAGIRCQCYYVESDVLERRFLELSK